MGSSLDASRDFVRSTGPAIYRDGVQLFGEERKAAIREYRASSDRYITLDEMGGQRTPQARPLPPCAFCGKLTFKEGQCRNCGARC